MDEKNKKAVFLKKYMMRVVGDLFFDKKVIPQHLQNWKKADNFLENCSVLYSSKAMLRSRFRN